MLSAFNQKKAIIKAFCVWLWNFVNLHFYTSLRSRKKKKLVKRPVDVLQEMRDIYKEEEDNLQGADMIEKVENYLRQDKS